MTLGNHIVLIEIGMVGLFWYLLEDIPSKLLSKENFPDDIGISLFKFS